VKIETMIEAMIIWNTILSTSSFRTRSYKNIIVKVRIAVLMPAELMARFLFDAAISRDISLDSYVFSKHISFSSLESALGIFHIW